MSIQKCVRAERGANVNWCWKILPLCKIETHTFDFLSPSIGIGDEPINQVKEVNINGREATLPLFLTCNTQSSAIHSSKKELSHMMRVWLAWMHLMLQETIVICYITNSCRRCTIAAVNRLQPEKGNGRARVQSPLWKTNFDLHVTIREFCQRMWENLNQIQQQTHVIDLRREGDPIVQISAKMMFG